MTPVFGITGWKNAGKTTLTTRLITEMVARGYRVHSVKHAHHDFDIDVPGTDSYRHRAAGATEVAIVSAHRYAVLHELRGAEEPSMQEVLARLSPADLVLIEGYKREPHPKIECLREGVKGERLSDHDPSIVALASDRPLAGERLPVLAIDDIRAIADFIERYLALSAPAPQQVAAGTGL